MSVAQVSSTSTESLLSLVGPLEYAKGHGTGNDFVLVADPHDVHAITPDQVAAICDRNRGIGGDGLIRAVPSAALPEGRAILRTEPAAEWFMDYRNADGSLSEMCGNGVRVFVHFLVSEKLVDLPLGATLFIGTRGGLKSVSRVPEGYAVDMGPWEFIFPQLATSNGLDSVVRTEGLSQARGALSVSMGNPHTVIAVATPQELAELELTINPVVEPHPPRGTNVEYVLPTEPLITNGLGSLTMRVHERGVGETLSCGTGACAAAVATRHWAGAQKTNQWMVEVPGGKLGVKFVLGETGKEHVILSGPAVLVTRGRICAQ
ncbi:diaminopimelate epimerase [Arthrobacter sp. MYb227]|uniref:diaminopimelate epimerase n=1 Tax=Arthrobacter sp. MYb227 TaxID=1848601 RepID=UPI000CFB6DEE|nr:diaminopimelate epimerase [Arthrobacter sp. MYb227]PQZ92835.1 diaminopimelate epimerase [Arthrobacter sp. MYb227]